MRQLLLATALLLISINASAHGDTVLIDTAKTNPIIYGDMGLGLGIAGAKGLQFNTGLNYQFKHNLFTLRYIYIADLDINPLLFAPIVIVPAIEEKGSLAEYALLYGRRFIKNGHAFSVSLGASVNKRVINYTDSNNQRQRTEDHYAGLPFEVNMMWFKSSKERFRIFHIIPVGKSTGFGSSIGFKLSGNLSQHSYAALGLVYGLGYHKRY